MYITLHVITVFIETADSGPLNLRRVVKVSDQGPIWSHNETDKTISEERINNGLNCSADVRLTRPLTLRGKKDGQVNKLGQTDSIAYCIYALFYRSY